MLRLIAHIAQEFGGPSVAGAWAFGAYGVDLFFVISGFVMVYTTSRKPIGPAQFMTNRVVRIAPLYWALTLLTYAIVVVVPSLFKATSSSPVELLKSLFFIAFEKSNGNVQPTLFLGWTLNYEMFFYALFAAGLMIHSVSTRVWTVCVALVLLTLVGVVVPPEASVARFYTSPLMLEFGYGMLIGLAYQRISSRPAAAAVSATLVAIGMALVVLGPGGSEDIRFLTVGLPAAATVLGAISLEARGIRFKSPALLLLGAASYSLYLVHIFPLGAVAYVAGRLEFGEPWLLLFAPVLAFVSAIAVAIVVHLAFERPIDRFLRRRVESWFGSDQSDAEALWPWRRRTVRSEGDKEREPG